MEIKVKDGSSENKVVKKNGKYIVADYISIAEAQFILDKIIINIKTEVGYAEISSGL